MGDKIASLYAEIGANTSGLERGLTSAKTGLAGLRTKLTDFGKAAAVPVAGLTAGFFALKSGIEATAGATMEYNKSILDLATAVGLTTEETSRIVQVADDLAISQGEVTSALQLMTKNGIAPSIENLAKLADQFNAYSDPAERAAEMSKLFGRNWAVLAPLLAEGGDALRANAAAISDSLIVTQESIEASERYRKNLDNLNDTVQGLKYSIGNELLPVLNDAAMAFDLMVNGRERIHSTLTQHAKDVALTSQSYSEYVAELTRAAKVAGYAVNAQGQLVQDMGMGARKVIDQTYVLTEAERETARVTANELTPALNGAADGLNGIAGSAADAAQATRDANDEMQAYSETLLYAKAAEVLTAEQAYELAKSMGLLDGTTVQAVDALNVLKDQLSAGAITADDYYRKVDLLNDVLESLDGKTVSVRVDMDMIERAFKAENTSYVGAMNTGSEKKTTATPRASGGPVIRGNAYWVGENGPELHVGGQNGVILTKSEAMRALAGNDSGGVTYNVNGPIHVTLAGGEADINSFLRSVQGAIA